MSHAFMVRKDRVSYAPPRPPPCSHPRRLASSKGYKPRRADLATCVTRLRV